MKGLLLKDFLLIKNRGKMLLLFLLFGLLGILNDTNFALIFTICISYFTVTTISYDEFEHGFPYLFSLPMTRGQYVTEKYVLSILLSGLAWIVYLLMHVLRLAVHRQDIAWTGILLLGFMGFVITLMILGISITIQLKFGAEKGRYVTWLVWGIFGGLLALIVGLTKNYAENSYNWLLVGYGLAALLLYVSSYGFSQAIVKKKEF